MIANTFRFHQWPATHRGRCAWLPFATDMPFLIGTDAHRRPFATDMPFLIGTDDYPMTVATDMPSLFRTARWMFIFCRI
jgi:hypothetical protein